MTRTRLYLAAPFISTVTILVNCGHAWAAVSTTDELTSYFRVLWGLLIVLAIILVLFALFRKRFSLVHARGPKVIKVLEIQPLMPRKAICLVEVRGRELLLGVGTDSITLLADLKSDNPASFEKILDDATSSRQP